MPGMDGAGPRGAGPMTGGCRGYCVMKKGDDGEESLSGFAGWPGRPFLLHRPDCGENRMQLEARLRDVGERMKVLHDRVAALANTYGQDGQTGCISRSEKTLS
ncbi:DUF5320 domain-containing protein [bacterium]|nr:DUF5320 domain-containing protein [bacterium]